MIKAIIIENEKKHSDLLLKMLTEHFKEVAVLKICDAVPEGILQVKLLKPELIFLDVELPPYSGFDLLEQTRDENYKVVFTTSYGKYAEKAFEFVSPLHYIRKPFGVEVLAEAIGRFKTWSEKVSRQSIDTLLHNIKQNDVSAQIVGIPVVNGFDFIPVSEIIMCKASDNYTEFNLKDKKKVLASKTLKWVEALLKEHHFFRIHDSYIINLQHIKKYRRGGEGGVVELSGGTEIDVSRRRKDDFLKILSAIKIISVS